MTSIAAYEKTPSGAHKITFLGDRVAGTFDDEIGALAERLAGEENANPVQVAIEIKDGKTHIKGMREIVPPAELGGTEAEAPAVGEVEEAAPVESPGDAIAIATIDQVLVDGIAAFSNQELMAEIERRLERPTLTQLAESA